MPKILSIEDLTTIREKAKKEFDSIAAEQTIITVGMGTCGQAAGAGNTLRVIENELEKREIQATIKMVGCIGMCVNEPLVDIQLPGKSRITYINVTPGRVKRIIEDHILLGQVVEEWALGVVPPEW